MRRLFFLLPAVFLLLFTAPVSAQDRQLEKKVRAFIAAFNSRNIDAMMSLAIDNVKWYTVAGDQVTTETANKAELGSFLTGYFKDCPTCRSSISGVSASGNRVTLTEAASWMKDGKRQTNSSAAVYEFENGLIARVYYHADPAKSTYDASLAKRLGADERGMKTYVFVNLIRGKKQFSTEERNRLVGLHLENINRLADSRKLLLAGPFFDNGDIRGIYIFDVDTLEKARELTETDPAVKAGVFEFEMRLWYGSAALIELDRIHKSIQKTKPGQ